MFSSVLKGELVRRYKSKKLRVKHSLVATESNCRPAVDMPEEGGRVSGCGTVTEITSLPAFTVRWPSCVRVVNG